MVEAEQLLKRHPNDIIINCECNKTLVGLSPEQFNSGKYVCPACYKNVIFNPEKTIVINSVVYTKLDKMKGWLLVLSIGLIIGVLSSLRSTIDYFKIHSMDLVNPEISLIILIMHVLFTIFAFVTGIYFWGKYKTGVTLLIITFVLLSAFSTFQYIAYKDVLLEWGEGLQRVIWTYILSIVWISYLLTSKRVKRTFT